MNALNEITTCFRDRKGLIQTFKRLSERKKNIKENQSRRSFRVSPQKRETLQ